VIILYPLFQGNLYFAAGYFISPFKSPFKKVFMNKILRPGSWILPVLLLLIVAFNLSGCHGGSEEPPINLDSVKTHAISVAEAAALTANFRNTDTLLQKKCPDFKSSMDFGYSEAFNSDTYRILLEQKDSLGRRAAGIRIYYGLGKTGQVQMVMVPYSQDGSDILNHLVALDNKPVPGISPAHTDSLSASGAQAMEQGQHCPTYCPPPNPIQPQ